MSLDNRYGAFIDPGLEVQPLARGSLDGVTFAVKDVFAIKGHASSAGNPTGCSAIRRRRSMPKRFAVC